jgi:hypothetical protein
MNFSKLVKDGVLNVHKAQNGSSLEMDIYETQNTHLHG